MLEIEPGWATAMADWIDADAQPGFPDGAEDSVYTGQNPPHLAANMPITRASEFMALPEFGAERFAQAQALRDGAAGREQLNVCTASGIVLDSLSENAREFGLNPDDLANRRKDACFPTLEDLKGSLGNEAITNKMKNSLTESSGFFRATRMGHYWHH